MFGEPWQNPTARNSGHWQSLRFISQLLFLFNFHLWCARTLIIEHGISLKEIISSDSSSWSFGKSFMSQATQVSTRQGTLLKHQKLLKRPFLCLCNAKLQGCALFPWKQRCFYSINICNNSWSTPRLLGEIGNDSPPFELVESENTVFFGFRMLVSRTDGCARLDISAPQVVSSNKEKTPRNSLTAVRMQLWAFAVQANVYGPASPLWSRRSPRRKHRSGPCFTSTAEPVVEVCFENAHNHIRGDTVLQGRSRGGI